MGISKQLENVSGTYLGRFWLWGQSISHSDLPVQDFRVRSSETVSHCLQSLGGYICSNKQMCFVIAAYLAHSGSPTFGLCSARIFTIYVVTVNCIQTKPGQLELNCNAAHAARRVI